MCKMYNIAEIRLWGMRMRTLCITMSDESLYQNYLEADHDAERENELKDWDAVSIEDWDNFKI